jgi:hypothetical protein
LTTKYHILQYRHEFVQVCSKNVKRTLSLKEK